AARARALARPRKTFGRLKAPLFTTGERSPGRICALPKRRSVRPLGVPRPVSEGRRAPPLPAEVTTAGRRPNGGGSPRFLLGAAMQGAEAEHQVARVDADYRSISE